MRTNLFLTLAVAAATAVFIPQSAQAQLYLKGGGGYASPFPKDNINSIKDIELKHGPNNGVGTIDLTRPYNDYIENKYGSGGEGFNASFGVGYFFTKNVGVELTGHYFKSIETNPQTTTVINSYTTNINSYAQSEQIRVAPALVIQGSREGANPYMRLGLMVPVAGQVIVKNKLILESNDYKGDLEAKAVFNGAFSIGYNSALGVNFPLTKNISMMVEGELITLNVKAAKSTVIEATQTTLDKTTGTITTETDVEKSFPNVADRETVYVDELTPDMNKDLTKPTYKLARMTSYNSIGARLMIRYNF